MAEVSKVIRLLDGATQTVYQGTAFISRQHFDWRLTVLRTSLDRLATQMVFPYQSIYIIALGATATQLGAINSAGMLAAAILGPVTGWLIDRLGAKRIYLGGIIMLSLSYLTYSLAQSWLLALAAMVTYWLGYSTSIHGCATICGNCLANRDRATGMMICETVGAGLLGMAGPLLGAYLVARFGGVNVSGIRPLYVVGLGITLLTFVLILTKLSDRRENAKGGSPRDILGDLLQVVRSGPHLRRWLMVASLTQLPHAMVFPFSQVYAHQEKGADVAVLGLMVTACAVTSIVSAIPLGRLADSIGRKKLLYTTIPLFVISNLVLIWSPSPAFLIVAGILQGFYYIGGPISAAIERELVPAAQMGRWIGMTRMCKMTACACMAFLAGLIWDGVGPQYVFLAFVGIDVLIRMPLLIRMPETLRERPESQPVA